LDVTVVFVTVLVSLFVDSQQKTTRVLVKGSVKQLLTRRKQRSKSSFFSGVMFMGMNSAA
jgi:hypothetical protein